MNLAFSKRFPWGQLTLFPERIISLHYKFPDDRQKQWDFRINSDVKMHDHFDMELARRIDPVKIHTIRKSDRWRAGMKIHFINNNRTKDRFQFASARCQSVQDVKFLWTMDELNFRHLKIYVDDRELARRDRVELAINYGFYKYDLFARWFYKYCPPVKEMEPRDQFIAEGFQLIHWTDKSY